MKLETLNLQNLLDLVDGAAIFSAGGGGDPETGYGIADKLASEGYTVRLVAPSEVPDNAKIVNFAVLVLRLLLNMMLMQRLKL